MAIFVIAGVPAGSFALVGALQATARRRIKTSNVERKRIQTPWNGMALLYPIAARWQIDFVV
jgi:hypothetical protein